MIEGLKIRLTTEQLDAVLGERITKELAKADEKIADLPEVKKAAEFLRNPSGATGDSINSAAVGKYRMNGGDPVGTLAEEIRQHQNLAKYLQFMRKYLIQNETYELDDQELWKLGLLRDLQLPRGVAFH